MIIINPLCVFLFVCLIHMHKSMFSILFVRNVIHVEVICSFLCCVIIAVLVIQGINTRGISTTCLVWCTTGVKVAWLLLDRSPFRAPWPIKGQHRYPMMPWEVKSFPVKGCCRTYTRLGWHCYSALNDVIRSAMASEITCLTIVYSTVYSRRRSKEALKLHVTGPCEGNAPGTGEFPAQRASNAEKLSIWWRHHDSLPNGNYLLSNIIRVT